MIKVFHSKSMKHSIFGDVDRAAADFVDGDEYFMAAILDTDELDVAWERSNHIHDAWDVFDNNDVLHTVCRNPIPEAEGRHRSSCVGDIFVKNGVAYIVAAVGFKEIGFTTR